MTRRSPYVGAAFRELHHEWRWYEQRAPGAGERLLRLIESKVQSICEAPESFPRDRSHPLARRAMLTSCSYDRARSMNPFRQASLHVTTRSPPT
jgi:plasmid stabilization system protein ParE